MGATRSCVGRHHAAQDGDHPNQDRALLEAMRAFELGCSAGDSASCLREGDIAHAEAPDKALPWFARACLSGHLQACRRIARVGETMPSDDPLVLAQALTCANRISDECPAIGRSHALLVRMAECGSYVSEEPGGVYSRDTSLRLLSYEPDLLTEAELAKLPAAEQRFMAEVDAEKRAIYLALGGSRKELARIDRENLRGALMMLAAKPTDKLSRELGVVQRIADERAGFAVPPATTEGIDPYERWLRFSTSLGDRLERAVAAEIGDDKAAALHRVHGRWFGSSSVTSIGSGGSCPGDRFD
jgi:hypothetical protein